MRRNGAAMLVLICNASDFSKIAAAKRLHVAKDLPASQSHHLRSSRYAISSSSNRRRIMRHGFPPAMQYGGTSFVTTEFAPMIAPSPMCTPGITVTFWPIQTSLPTTVSPFSGRSSSAGRERFPSAAQDIERIGRDAVHPVVRAVHHKFDPPCDGAEFPDDEPVTQKFSNVRHVLFKSLRAVHIVIVAVLSNNDVGAA